MKRSALFVQAAAIAVPIVAPSDGAEPLEHESRRLGQNGRVLELSLLFTLCLLLVNNAGIIALGGVLDLDPADWDRVFETNLNACFLLSKLAARSMVQQGRGKIINIASELSLFGSGQVPSYSASKGAVVQLTKSMAIELARFNIQVNAIAPGFIDTDMVAPLKSMPLYDEIIKRTPAGRFGTPEECAGTAIYLASQASDFVTGTTLFLDGGFAIR